MEVEITEVVDGGMTSQWCSLYPFLVRTITGSERTVYGLVFCNDPFWISLGRISLASHPC